MIDNYRLEKILRIIRPFIKKYWNGNSPLIVRGYCPIIRFLQQSLFKTSKCTLFIILYLIASLSIVFLFIRLPFLRATSFDAPICSQLFHEVLPFKRRQSGINCFLGSHNQLFSRLLVEIGLRFAILLNV